ncbi:hypothetical protein [Muribaculum intestinale]|uniref:hypothetical protein n=1 Tax=Muribaculum intestinale TaxID=1796646 RepID=UPI00272D45E5|nr:hypothetical protein [Muribaculum intestinale]
MLGCKDAPEVVNAIKEKIKLKQMEDNKLTPFADVPDTAVITCCHVTDDGAPVLYVSHDDDDGMWQFLCGGEHSEDEARIVSLRYIYELDNSLGLLKDLPCGYCAERESLKGKWEIYQQ